MDKEIEKLKKEIAELRVLINNALYEINTGRITYAKETLKSCLISEE
jgi:ribosomal protein L29